MCTSRRQAQGLPRHLPLRHWQLTCPKTCHSSQPPALTADPHVVRFKNLFLTNSHLAVVLEYVEGGDLFQYCAENGPLPEEQARRFFQQLVIGLDYCHAMGVVNRCA